MKILLPLSALILLLSIGYFVHKQNEYSQLSKDSKPYSNDAVQNGQDIQKGRDFPPAVAKAKLQLASVGGIDKVTVIIEGSQNDKRDITYEYEWFKNGQPFGGNDDNATGFKKGDKIDVKVTPFDGKQYGQPVLLSFTIARVPPKIVENKAISFDGDSLSYQVKAVDQDGGTLSYSLIDPPKDMTIDSKTGIINWRVRTKEDGKHNVNVMIKSSGGAEAVYPLTIDIAKVNE